MTSRSQPISGAVVGSEHSAAFTPGPWFIGEDDSNGQAVVRGEHTEVATCWHHCVVEIEREMRANALLIAAAPELLEALAPFAQEFGADIPRPDDLKLYGNLTLGNFRRAIAAYAKALGQ